MTTERSPALAYVPEALIPIQDPETRRRGCRAVLLRSSGEHNSLSPSGLTVEWTEDSRHQGKCISVPEDVYERGCVKDVEEGLEVAAGCAGPAWC